MKLKKKSPFIDYADIVEPVHNKQLHDDGRLLTVGLYTRFKCYNFVTFTLTTMNWERRGVEAHFIVVH
jgi:hypothetical protein